MLAAALVNRVTRLSFLSEPRHIETIVSCLPHTLLVPVQPRIELMTFDRARSLRPDTDQFKLKGSTDNSDGRRSPPFNILSFFQQHPRTPPRSELTIFEF